MGIGKLIKNATVGTAKIAGSAVLGTIGVASTIVEGLGAGSNITVLEDMGHGLKSASFNGVRKIWGKDKKEFDHSAGDVGRRKADEIRSQEAEIKQNQHTNNPPNVEHAIHTNKYSRRTDEELRSNTSGLDKVARDFQHANSVPLLSALQTAESIPGVYILWLDGVAMKCGRASYDKGAQSGVRWRLKQYYDLNYDDRARNGEYWSVSPDNKDKIVVSWQCCPISKCNELEYKLFQKYGKGPWALRAPANCQDDTWDLLI